LPEPARQPARSLKDRLFRVFASIGEIAGIGQIPENLKRLGPGRILSLIKMLALLETASATAPCPSSRAGLALPMLTLGSPGSSPFSMSSTFFAYMRSS
jgi:hypothetical protein